MKTLEAPAPLFDPAELGPHTGTCACCGKPLTAPASVARGLGPVCGARVNAAERRSVLTASLDALRAINADLLAAPALPIPVQLPLFAA